MKARPFGVELEFGLDCTIAPDSPEKERAVRDIKNGTQDRYRNRTFGLELLRRWQNEGKVSREWFGHGDGTMLEFASPILKGVQGFKELKRMTSLLVEHGGYVTHRDGLHVHHDATEFLKKPELTVTLLKAWRANRSWVDRFIAPSRRATGHGWAYPVTDDHVRGLETRLKQGESLGYAVRYFGEFDVNVLALNKYGTIELRLHEGTLDFDEIEAWVRFGQAFINRVVQGDAVILSPPTARRHAVTLQQYKLPRAAQEQLARKGKFKLPELSAA